MRTILAHRAGVLACAVLLAGLCGCLVHKHCRPCETPLSTSQRLDGPACEDERPLTDLGGFGMRPTRLMERTGLRVEDLPFLKHFRARVGVPLDKVETFAMICFDASKRALLVRTTRDLEQGNVMMACEAGNLMPRSCECAPKVTTGKSGLALHFVSPRVLLITDGPATMINCLKQLPAMMAHLDKASEVDVSVWGRAMTMKKLETPPERTSAYYGANVCRIYRAAPPRVDEETTIDFLPMVVPCKAKMVRASLTLLRGADLTIEVDFADETSATRGKDIVTTYLELGRGVLTQFTAKTAMTKVVPEVGGDEGEEKTKVTEEELIAALPLDMLKRVEKGMRDVSTKVEAKRVTASLHVALEEADRAKVRKLFAAIEPMFVDKAKHPGLVFEPRERHYPVPPEPIPEPAPRSPLDNVKITPVIPPSDVVAVVPGAAEKWTLTVASVLEAETALLFTVDPSGELTFVAKLPPGKAIDVSAEKGQRWAATFMSEPHRAMHTVSADRQVFLLRPAPVPFPATVAPISVR